MSAAAPSVAFGPKRESFEKWRTADGRPRTKWGAIIGGEVQQEVAIRGKITTSLVDPPTQPLAEFKSVIRGVPFDEQHAVAGTTTKHYSDWGFTGEDRIEADAARRG